jgi:hypothetical protein
MRLAGRFLVLLGILFMVLGAGQLLLAELCSTDPQPNLAGNGMLMALGWYGGHHRHWPRPRRRPE